MAGLSVTLGLEHDTTKVSYSFPEPLYFNELISFFMFGEQFMTLVVQKNVHGVAIGGDLDYSNGMPSCYRRMVSFLFYDNVLLLQENVSNSFSLLSFLHAP